MATRKVTYLGQYDEVEVPELGVMVKRNRQIEVPNELAVRLLENPDWRTVGRGEAAEDDDEEVTGG